MKSGEYLLVRDIVDPSYPDGTNSIRRTQAVRVKIEWIDGIPELNRFSFAGDWRIAEVTEQNQEEEG